MNLHAPDRNALPDHAAETDDRAVPIDKVGIRGLRWPIKVMDRAHRSQATIAVVDMLRPTATA